MVPLWVPPLRDRKDDILPLARLFMDRFARQFKKPFKDISPAAEQVLVGYAWPGNIRELRNLFERTVLLEQGEVLEPHHLKLAMRARPSDQATLGQRIDGYLTASPGESPIPFEPLVEELERALILHVSYATKWNQSRTAEMLNLKRDKLRYRMKLYEIHAEDGAPAPQD